MLAEVVRLPRADLCFCDPIRIAQGGAMARTGFRSVAVLLAVLVAAACTVRTGSAPPSSPAAQAPAQSPQALDENQKMWDELAAAARAEGGKVVIATSTTGVREVMAEAFKKRFGVELEVIIGRGSEAVGRIMRERDADVRTIDVLQSGMGSVSSQLYPVGALASVRSMLVVPEVVDPSKWRDNRIRFADPDDQYILRSVESVQNNIVINTDFVKRDELRRSDDLLNPKFQGKIASMDPMVQGGGDGSAGYFLKTKGEDYLRRLYQDQKPVFSQDQRQLADWTARGAYPINLTFREEDILEMQRDGIKIEAFWFDDIPPMVGAGGGFFTVLEGAPHPAATKLYVNWFASKEGQNLYTTVIGQPSNRLDVENNAKLPAFLRPPPGRELFDLNDWSFVTSEERPLRAQMRALLGG
jgi:iron(III) transport system substrate-binding protein